jgi:U3 small nucleolar RNA-associated protein 6
MLAELKDFGEKGLFSAKEIKHIVKKRTAFETALVRRIPNKNDYLRYATYEMGLEALRRKRVARLSASLPHPILCLPTIKRVTKVPTIDIGLCADA